MRFYRRYPDAALAGMAKLNSQQRGVYNSILDLLYSCDGVVADDDRAVAHAIALDIREYRNVKSQLMAAGKVRTQDGFLSANGVSSVLAEAQLRSSCARANAQLRGKREEKANDYKRAKKQNGSKRAAIPISLKAIEPEPPKSQPEERIPTTTELAALGRLQGLK